VRVTEDEHTVISTMALASEIVRAGMLTLLLDHGGRHDDLRERRTVP
jgi:hypothetical protein